MATAPTKWTVAMVHALPDDGNRYEVIDGELFVTPAPSWNHQDAVGEMFDRRGCPPLLIDLPAYFAEVLAE